MTENINPNEPVDLKDLEKKLEARSKEWNEAARKLNDEADGIQTLLEDSEKSKRLTPDELTRLQERYVFLEKTLKEQYNGYQRKARKERAEPKRRSDDGSGGPSSGSLSDPPGAHSYYSYPGGDGSRQWG